MKYYLHTLSNGITLIHKATAGDLAHCGVLIKAGTRDEKEGKNGIAHLAEHCLFKGTEKRKAYYVLSRLENVGGDMNAFTTKEETCIYASFFPRYYDMTLELFSDILGHSVFPEREVRKEKEVILDEIHSYQDNPFDMIFDEIEEIVFRDHPMGKNILGTPETLEKITRKDLLGFTTSTYHADRMVIWSAGKIHPDRLAGLVRKYFNACKNGRIPARRSPGPEVIPGDKTVEKDIFQAHFIMGMPAYSMQDDRRIPLVLINNILGGPGSNSRLNMQLREKYGYTYQVESSFQSFSDTGLFTVYLGTDNRHLDRSVELATREIEKLKTLKMGLLQLSRAKMQLAGQLAMAVESPVSEMGSVAKHYLHTGHLLTFEEFRKKIEAVTAKELLEVANEALATGHASKLTYTAAKAPS
jgi:predicted Zn-dependent peptidase